MRDCGLSDDAPICQEISGQEDVICPNDCPHSSGELPFSIDDGASSDAWAIAQEGELEWWAERSQNTYFEERKQLMMAERIGLKPDSGYRIDLNGRSVLDVGGGATSLLLKCINGGRRVVLDPLSFPEWINERYQAAGITFQRGMAEDLCEEDFDEVWIYNVLQHVKDPREVLRRAIKAGSILRIFEWTNTGTNEMHLHTITAELIREELSEGGESGEIINVDGLPANAFWGVFQRPTEEPIPSPVISEEHHPSRTSGRDGLVFHIPAIPHTVTNKEFLSCFSDDTDIMTEDGWRSLKGLVESDAKIRVATLNPETNLVEYHFPDRWISNDYKGKMFHQTGQVDLMVTPEHRLWIRTINDKRLDNPFRYEEAKNIPKLVQYRTDFPWQEGEDVSTFVLPEHQRGNGVYRSERSFEMDKWLEFMGWYLSEGSIGYVSYDSSTGTRRNAYLISIAQQKDVVKIESIRSLLIDMNIDHNYNGKAFIICDVQLAVWLERFGKSYDKWIPQEYKNMPRRQMTILFDALVSGGGWTYSTGKRYVTYSERLANDICEIGLKLGYHVSCYDDQNPDKPRHVLTFGKRVNPVCNRQKDHREWIEYDGMVFCLVVQNHIVYVRRNGKSVWASQCAYSQKVTKLCSMLTDLGHTVYHYGCEGSEVNCTEDIPVVTDEYRQQFYPNLSREHQFSFNIDDEYHHTFRGRIADQIKLRLGEKNLLLCAWGFGHKEISDLLGDSVVTVESGIGYTDTFASYRIFESYAWMHWVYGKNQQHDGGWYDAVIPNYFDPNEFEVCDEKDDYLLYIGRIVKRKGVELASQLAERTGHRLVVAGQGTLKNESEGIDLKGDHIDFVGYADVEKRKRLMSRAKAVLVPTYYIGPFEGVSVEAMMSGSPVITSDWGVFPESVVHGVTGYRCRTMDQFEWAVRNIGNIRSEDCRRWAVENYSMDRVALMYDEYFSMISDLWGKGWYQENPGRTELDWLRKV